MNPDAPTLYLAWQDERTRTWFTVGRLCSLPDRTYEFVYTRGYDNARAAGMQPIIGFDDLFRRYVSEELFPLFQNRLMSKTREDYHSYLSRLGLADQRAPEPMVILALSGGRRNTDSFYLFPSPTRTQGSQERIEYRLGFFVHGISHVPASSQDRIARLVAGDRLRLMWDWQNPHDARAIMLRSDDNEAPYLLGWVPRFYRADLHQLREKKVEIVVTVQRVNPQDAPSWSRLLCSLSALWPNGFQPFSDNEYQRFGAPT